MDKRAAVIAGLLAAIISLLLGMGALHFLHDNAIGLPRLLATIVLGRGALDPDITVSLHGKALTTARSCASRMHGSHNQGCSTDTADRGGFPVRSAAAGRAHNDW